MSDRELRQLFAQHSRDIDARQRARMRELKGLERELFEALVRKLTDSLAIGDGVILTDRGSASINRLVDEVFRAMDRAGLRTFYKAAVTDLFAILGNNDRYFENLFPEVSKASDKRFRSMRASVDRIMRAKLGIDDSGRLKPDGMLGKLFRSEAMRTAVKEMLNAGARKGTPISKLVRQLEITVKGTRENIGTLRKSFEPLVFDTYQQFDRASNDTYATKIGLDCFIYVGGLIETSREFCIKKNGQVFTKSEAEKLWPKDSTLPRTSAERRSGTLVGYNPTVDMGRWNCRHRTRYIPRALAEQLRPDIPNSHK